MFLSSLFYLLLFVFFGYEKTTTHVSKMLVETVGLYVMQQASFAGGGVNISLGVIST